MFRVNKITIPFVASLWSSKAQVVGTPDKKDPQVTSLQGATHTRGCRSHQKVYFGGLLHCVATVTICHVPKAPHRLSIIFIKLVVLPIRAHQHPTMSKRTNP